MQQSRTTPKKATNVNHRCLSREIICMLELANSLYVRYFLTAYNPTSPITHCTQFS